VRFQPPCDTELAGYLPTLQHWPWTDAESRQLVPALHTEHPINARTFDGEEATMPSDRPGTSSPAPAATSLSARPDLVVLSHLRWPWVWQRPQHIVSRLARGRAESGARTWFVEEPVVDDVPQASLHTEDVDGVTRVWLVLPVSESPVPRTENHPRERGFEDPATSSYGRLLAEALGDRPLPADVWLYTPMALDIAQDLRGGRLIYDVMDDLASFAHAPAGLVLRQRRLLAEADVVFTGGLSLHRSVLRQRQDDVHLFRSGVEAAHYASSRDLRRQHDRPVAGYVGVIDERLDPVLLAELAEALPDWTIRLVGPVAKIDERTLPRADNIEYPGMTSYGRLPAVMAELDVALMPFALNESTRSISPTKTLEYLAAGLPVVSTRVPDVVSDYGEVVHLADDGAQFAAACCKALREDARLRDRRVRPLLARQEWDEIASSMAELVDGVSSNVSSIVSSTAEQRSDVTA
jgi:hypothetical protein